MLDISIPVPKVKELPLGVESNPQMLFDYDLYGVYCVAKTRPETTELVTNQILGEKLFNLCLVTRSWNHAIHTSLGLMMRDKSEVTQF